MRRLRLEQVDAALASFQAVRGLPGPNGGWLRTVREALGLTVRQQATRLGVAAATLHQSERSEADERISLAQLRKLAASLDCDLVYSLAPRRPLTAMVDAQAARIAREEVLTVAHSMTLEGHRPSEKFLKAQIDVRRAELLDC